ncbi:MAG: HD-GYP domain-containing protein [Clostridia bacterium]|nr:HD-GYP domain-containing protein [Clostridia bacterium]
MEDSFLQDVEPIDVVAETTRLHAVRSLKSFYLDVGRSLSLNKAPRIRGPEISGVINTVLDDILGQKDIMVNLVDIRTLGDSTFFHSVNVCTLSILAGISMGYNRPGLYQLGVGSLLHDIGKVLVPPEILHKPGKLTKAEFDEMKKHPQYGYNILREMPNISLASANVAFEHHERYNGEGYPRELSGKEIHEYAQITGLADIYDALTSDRIYRKAYPHHEAIEMIAASGNFYFEHRVVKAFLDNIAVYPIGTPVELNNGEIAVVLNTPRGYPHLPDVRVVSSGGRTLRVCFDRRLIEEKALLISRVIPEEEFADMEGMENVLES